MIQKKDKTPQLEMFKTPLIHFIKKDHELALLSGKIDWDKLEDALSIYYCLNNGRPGIPIRTIAGILIIKRMFNESDESVLERWIENPYWSRIFGMAKFISSMTHLLTEQN